MSLSSLAQPNPRRSLILCAIGAIVGLAIAGLGLFTAQGTRTSGVPADDVAIVNQEPILMSDYVVQLRALYNVSLSQATPQQKKQVLDDMIREALYVQRGIELDMQADTIEVRQALVGAVEAQATIDATLAQPDPAQLQAWYNAHLADYSTEGTLALDDYIVPGTDVSSARALAAALRTGRTAASLGLRRTTRMGADDEFYFAARIHLGDRMFAVARTLPAAGVSDPIVQPDGLHILVVRRNRVPMPIGFAAARNRVLNDTITAQAKLLTAGNERFLRKRAYIVIQQGFE